MADAKHTPGPWRYVDESDMTPEEPFWIGAEHPTCGFVSHACVRSGSTESDELGDLEANARLIAAAPELLEALKNLLCGCTDGDGERWIPPRGCLDDAKAAIAKATGSAA
jgi:hypothetical protein